MAAVSGSDLVQTLNAQLGEYVRTYRKELQTALKQPSESEMYMSSVPGVKGEYVSYTAEVGQTLQPYQEGWTPTGGENIKPMVAKVFPIKIDKEYANLEKMFQTHAGWLADEKKNAEEQPIVQWIIMQMLEKAREEIELSCATASYVAPTAGTAGTVAQMYDGFLTILAREITNSNIAPVTSGAFTTADIYDNFKFFINQIEPFKVRRLYNANRPFFMSEQNAYNLWEDYRDQNSTALDYSRSVQPDGSFTIPVGNLMVRVKGLPSMAGSNRFLGLTKDNFRRMYDQIVTPGQFRVGYLKRHVYVEGLFHRGYAFEVGEEVYCNDQA